MTKSLSKAIALATLVGVSASAQAAVTDVTVNPDGLGEVLLYSLYTAENGNITNINITNTTNLAKAVKVRFLEGQNSQEVLDFNLYLSPRDQWSGAVTQTADGAMLISADKSCTVPAITAAGVPFRDLDYIGDTGEQSLARTRVGHLEVIEMGTVDNTPFGRQLFNAIKAGSQPNLAPNDCGFVTSSFATGGQWANPAAVQDGLSTVGSGGLYGSANVLNIDGSTQISYDAIAIQNFKDQDSTVADNTLHAVPGSIYPTLNGAIAPGVAGRTRTKATTTSNVPSGAPALVAAPGAPTSTVASITEELAVSQIHNDYVLDAGRGSQTNWVITYPTKRFHVDVNMPDSLARIAGVPLLRLQANLQLAQAAKIGDTVSLEQVIGGVVVKVPYTLEASPVAPVVYPTATAAGGSITPANLIANITALVGPAQVQATNALRPFQKNWANGQSCDRILIDAWDHEEFVRSSLDFSPSRPGAGPQLCYETNILTFNGTDVLGGEFVTENINLTQPDFQFGWMNIDFLVPAIVGTGTVANPQHLAGQALPAIGFSAVTVKNNFTGNGLANNYGSSTSHKATR